MVPRKLAMPDPAVFAIVIVPKLVRVPEISLSMPMPLVFDTVIIPLLVRVLVLKMPEPKPPVFDTVIVPKLVRVASLKMPSLLPVFDTVIVPKLVRVPMLVMPVPAEFDITSVVPSGTTSSSPVAIVLPLVLIVHVFVGIFHVPPYVGHDEASSVMVVACASWVAKVDNVKIKAAKIER